MSTREQWRLFFVLVTSVLVVSIGVTALSGKSWQVHLIVLSGLLAANGLIWWVLRRRREALAAGGEADR